MKKQRRHCIDSVGMAAVESADSEAPSKTVLITGASRGCGRALALEFARMGHTVIGAARSEEKLESLRQECARLNGLPHIFTALDVADDAGVKELARRVVEAGQVPDIVGTSGFAQPRLVRELARSPLVASSKQWLRLSLTSDVRFYEK